MFYPLRRLLALEIDVTWCNVIVRFTNFVRVT